MTVAASTLSTASFAITIGALAAVVVAIGFSFFTVRMERMRRRYEVEAALGELRNVTTLRDEQLQRALDDLKQTRAERVKNDDPEPLPAGQYLIVSYDVDEGMRLIDLQLQAQQVVVLLITMLSLVESSDDHLREQAESIRIKRIHYGSPFDVVLIIQGVQAGIGALAGIAVGVNAAIQRMRRSWTETTRRQSEDKRDAARADLDRLMTEQLQGIVRGEISAEQIARLTSAAEGLKSIAYREVEGPRQLAGGTPN